MGPVILIIYQKKFLKMRFNLINNLSALLCAGLLFTSCVKEEAKPQGDAGNTIVKVLEAPERKIFFSPFSDTKTVDLFSLRRDANSQGSLNTPSSIDIKFSQQMIDDYNDANGESFEPMPDSIFSFKSIPGVQETADGFTMDYSAGDFAKELTIQLDGSKWDISHKYAFAYVISEAGGNQVGAGKDSVIVLISVKNKWDGVYDVTGTMVDAVNPALVHVTKALNSVYGIGQEYHLVTVSPTACAVYDNTVYGDYIVPISTGGGTGLSGYGDFALLVEFDPETDEIVNVSNYYGTPANTRAAVLDESGENRYNAASKTINIKFHMLQPSVVPAAPYIRSSWDEVWKYTGSR